MKMLLNPPTDADSEEEGREPPDLQAATKLLHDYAPCIEPFRVRTEKLSHSIVSN